jgi:hypothetical protein
MTHTPEHNAWLAMRKRCYNPKFIGFASYGGRGIIVCERWRTSFENFFADLGPRPEGCSLDRIDVDGNYEPGNVRWASSKQQCNNRRSNRLLTYKGEEKTLAEWAAHLGVKRVTLGARLRRMSVEEAFELTR